MVAVIDELFAAHPAVSQPAQHGKPDEDDAVGKQRRPEMSRPTGHDGVVSAESHCGKTGRAAADADYPQRPRAG